ncbi:prepilin-type cleavage/methylation N-terminal domain protein [Peptostreptococcaceae bacterium AS15]|nr:prepilin-type cleavage/methylation N-terminal domain protein [Peptostreptococcaceae bacterium AS15]
MRKSRAFTLVELVTVVVIIGILLMMVVPTMSETRDGVSKNQTNTTHKIFVNAIDYWIKDNINPAQRPANFFSKNSQGKNVLDYIAVKDVFDSTNISKDSGSANGYKLNTPFVAEYRQVEVKFERGVLKTTFMFSESDGTFSSRGDKASLTYGIYDMDASGNIKDYNTLVNNKFIVVGNYVELK